ncbi:hypothetical protein SCAR479_00763 [Seiridium cardinale]|uniref:Uncharacterized protein n=1 Tax=Seiridium cardinale TaxID=138064 RepID=A0ABR2Y756_9PEZI
MFEDFTFDQKKVKSSDRSDLEPHLSPKDAPVDRLPLQAAPAIRRPTYHHHDGQSASGTIDTLVQQMSRQTLLPYVRSDGRLRAIPQLEDSTGWPVPIYRPNYSIPPRQNPPSVAPTRSEKVSEAPLAALSATGSRYVATGPASSPASCPSQLRLDPELSSNTSNPRAVREALVEDMITNGVQCKVQASSSIAPVSTSPSTVPTIPASKVEDDTDLSMLDVDQSQDVLGPIEVDDAFDEKREEALLRSMVSLRQAGAPGGIRRSSGLRFCTSAEAALKQKNLKRNKIKMRKRDKPKSIEAAQMPTPPPEDVGTQLSV